MIGRVGIQLLLPIAVAILASVLGPPSLLAHSGTEQYVKDRRVGPYVIDVWVEMPEEQEETTGIIIGGKTAEVSVLVRDAVTGDPVTGDPVTDASVVVVAGLRDEGTAELRTLGPYVAPPSLNQPVGLYGVVVPVEPLERAGPWLVLVSVSDERTDTREEVSFQLDHDDAGGLNWALISGGLGAGGFVGLTAGVLAVRRRRRGRPVAL